MELTTVPTNGKVTHARERQYSLLKADAKAVEVMWPTIIRPGLLKVKEKDKRSGHWLPEHVRAAIDAGHLGRLFCECQLIIPASEPQPCGFLILRMYNDEFMNVPLSLFVWIAYTSDPRATVYLARHELVEKRAREIGVNRIEGVSSRFGWGRRLRRYGYDVHQVIYRKELS